jgi:hypothetical protein
MRAQRVCLALCLFLLLVGLVAGAIYFSLPGPHHREDPIADQRTFADDGCDDDECREGRRRGPKGDKGAKGDKGDKGDQGDAGLPGVCAAPCLNVTGPAGKDGLNGTTTTITTIVTVPGFNATYGYFFGLMPGDNSATIAVGAPLLFPQNGAANGIVRASAGSFILPNVGVYEVFWQASIDEPGQLMLDLNPGGGPALLAETVAGRATGTSQIVNQVDVTVAVAGSVLRVINPPGNAAALTVTPTAGGTHAVSCRLGIRQIH